MTFLAAWTAFERELDEYYAGYPSDRAVLEAELHAIDTRWPASRRKALGYGVLAERCAVKVFRHCPFYFELDTGRARTDLGEGGIGGWLKREPFGLELLNQGVSWWRLCEQSGLSCGWPVLDDNHHTFGYDQVFRFGLQGLAEQAAERLRTAEAEQERDFLESAIAGLQAAMTVAGRFAAEAERLAAAETDPGIRRRLERIADSARRVPAAPPATFYETLNTLIFLREVVESMEGNGISILGHLDRLLEPYYQRDLAEGRITPEEAEDLLRYFLAIYDTKFGMRTTRDHVGTNTTVIIGGCQVDGTPIFNDITRMVVEVYRELRLVDPKLNARISACHPAEYFTLLAELIASGNNGLAIFNDDVVIAANARMGKALEDCRLYVGGGCQENVLENTEVNSRATIYLNLPQVLLMGFFPGQWQWLEERDGIRLADYAGCTTFAELYQVFLDNLRAVTDAHVAQRNRTEAEGVRYNPCPLHSASMLDCLEKARDMMEGGARYNFGSVALAGIGTLVDALYAIREAVFTRGRLSLDQLRDALASDFQGEEELRGYLLRLPKYGQEDDAIQAFSTRVFADVARAASGQPNSRGGVYEASLFSFRTFVPLGQGTGATPDGRHAGEYLSPGMSPSLLALGRQSSIGQVLNAIQPLDLTDYPVVAVLDLKLPAARGGYPPPVLVSVLWRFLDCGGSVLQINTVDPATLLDAKAHPERHPDLVVRVSGYSAYFNTLSEAIQEEVIERTLVV